MLSVLRWRAVVVAVLLVTATIGCSDEEPSPSAMIPVVGFIRCIADGARVQSPIVAGPDGVHFVVTALGDLDVRIAADPPVAMGLRPGEFGPMAMDTSSGHAVSQLGPGDYEIACRDGRTDEILPVQARLTVVDPNGLWVDDRLTCEDRSIGIIDYGEGAQGERGDLSAAFRRHVTGLLPTDQVTRAGYPAAATREVRIVRDGAVVALGTYEAYDPGNWLLSTVEKCGSADIGG
jgi:hypothetical protein